MLNDKLTELKNYILEYNTYFDSGYDAVYQDLVNGLIMQDNKPVFPADNKGNYFYLRLPDTMRFVYDRNKYNTDDCGFNFGISASVYLVAYVKNAHPDLLFNNLVNTLQEFTNADLKFTGGIYKKELVIQQELKKYAKEDIATALKNVKSNDALVSINFDMATIFTKKKLSCLETPCIC